MASLVPAIMTRTAWSAGTTLEALAGASASTAALRTATTIVGAPATAVWTATAIIAAAVTSAAAEGALETLARIAANARGVARKFFARRWGAPYAARSASFSRQQDDVVLGDRRGRGSEIVYRDVPGGGALRFFLAVGSFVMTFVMSFVMFSIMFAGMGMFFVVKSKCRMMFGAFVRGICFCFGTIRGAAFFDLGGFVVGEFRNFCVWLLGFGFFLYFILFFFDFFLFFKNRVTGESGNLRNFLYFFLLGFNKAGPEHCDLIVV
jgi:hypothetical protein